MKMQQAAWLAAITMFGGSAAAQSGVTLYGAIDLSLRSVKNGSAGTIRSLSPGNNIASRLGFTGSEDLGGGLRASFILETDIGADTGTVGSTSTTFSSFFNRRANLSLISDKLGEIRLGREYSPTHYSFCVFEAFGCIGLGGSKMAFDNSSTTYAGTSSVLGAAFGAVAGPTANQNPTLRVNNSVQYLLPENLGGLTGAVMVAPGEGAATSVNGNSKVFAGRVGYAAGPVMVNAATMTTKNTLVAGESFRDTVLMGSYDFGVVKLYAARRTYTFIAEKMVQTVLNATVPVGSFGVLKLAYDKANQTSATASRNADDAALYAVGYDHILSKRTRLYTTVARLANSGNARYSIVTGPNGIRAGETASAYEVGMRHSF